MSSLAIFFFFFLSLHACNARRLGFVAEEIGNHVDFLAKVSAEKLIYVIIVYMLKFGLIIPKLKKI